MTDEENKPITHTHTGKDPVTGKGVTVTYTTDLPETGEAPDPLDAVGSHMKPDLFSSLSDQPLKSEEGTEEAE